MLSLVEHEKRFITSGPGILPEKFKDNFKVCRGVGCGLFLL